MRISWAAIQSQRATVVNVAGVVYWPPERRVYEKADSVRADPGTSRPVRRPGPTGYFRLDGRAGSRKHDGPTGYQEAAIRSEWQRVGAQPRELRRGDCEPVPGSAGGADTAERNESFDAGIVVEGTQTRDRRGLRTRGVGSRTAKRPEGDVDGRHHVANDSRRSCSSRQAAQWTCRRITGRHRHPDDAGGSCGRPIASAGDDDVRQRIVYAARSRRSAGRKRPAGDGAA